MRYTGVLIGGVFIKSYETLVIIHNNNTRYAQQQPKATYTKIKEHNQQKIAKNKLNTLDSIRI
jgi:hypothetical protein